MNRILIADDQKGFRTLIVTELSASGYETDEADCGTAALQKLEKTDYAVLLLDLNMPDLGGMDVLKKVKAMDLSVEVIILTAHATVNTAVESMKLGAYDYLVKPFSIDELKAVIERAIEKRWLSSQNVLLKTQLRRCGPGPIVTRSPLMLSAIEIVQRAARSDAPVLIYGESGTGKELFAWRLHEASARSSGPFVPLNCGAIPEGMLESELFGYEKGAFTGASVRKPGLLEIADQGTLFLDEIGDMPLQIQVKLLRVIETGRFFRLGGTREVGVDVKYVAATNKNLEKETESGRFRPDLYYRISAITISVPPLRNRPEDIPLLVEHFLKSNPTFSHKSFTQEALQVMTRYPWPGNVRELFNVLHRALLLSSGERVGPGDLPADLGRPRHVRSMKLEDIEREHILKVFRETGNHRAKTAEILGIAQKTLYRKLKSYGVDE